MSDVRNETGFATVISAQRTRRGSEMCGLGRVSWGKTGSEWGS